MATSVQTRNRVTTKPATKPTPSHLAEDGRVLYDPTTWLKEAIVWVPENEKFRVAAALLNAFDKGEISKDFAFEAAYEWWYTLKMMDGQRQFQRIRDYIRRTGGHRNPVTLGTIWYLAVEGGWKVDADETRDREIILNR